MTNIKKLNISKSLLLDCKQTIKDFPLAYETYGKLNENKDSISENEDQIFAPSHYCIHHGGVHHEGKIQMAEAVQHVEPDKNGHISHYDMKLEDGTVLENVAAEDIAELMAKKSSDSSNGINIYTRLDI